MTNQFPGRAGRRRPTSADVARRAGLSRTTVSFVLNNTPNQAIPERTRQRVLAAAAELGYTPSPAARTLSRGRSDVVMLLLPDWPIGASFGRTLVALSSALAANRLGFVAHPRAPGQPASEMWKRITPAAVVTFEELDEAEEASLRSAGITLTVTLLATRGGAGAGAVLVPERGAGRLQARHLASVGHRRLGYAWPEDDRLVVFAGPRLEGVRQTCTALGLPQPVVATVPLDPAGASRAVGIFRGGADPVTGVCAYNDDVALAVLSGARQQGLDVPADLAVVGVDNSPFAALVTPALTTVDTDSEALARHIAETVVRQLDGGLESAVAPPSIHAVVRRLTS